MWCDCVLVGVGTVMLSQHIKIKTLDICRPVNVKCIFTGNQTWQGGIPMFTRQPGCFPPESKGPKSCDSVVHLRAIICIASSNPAFLLGCSCAIRAWRLTHDSKPLLQEQLPLQSLLRVGQWRIISIYFLHGVGFHGRVESSFL